MATYSLGISLPPNEDNQWATVQFYEKFLKDGGGSLNKFGGEGYFGPTFSSEQEALLYVGKLFTMTPFVGGHVNLYEHVGGRCHVRSYADRKAIEAALKEYL